MAIVFRACRRTRRRDQDRYPSLGQARRQACFRGPGAAGRGSSRRRRSGRRSLHVISSCLPSFFCSVAAHADRRYRTTASFPGSFRPSSPSKCLYTRRSELNLALLRVGVAAGKTAFGTASASRCVYRSVGKCRGFFVLLRTDPPGDEASWRRAAVEMGPLPDSPAACARRGWQ
jgi:hypothetical protein